MEGKKKQEKKLKTKQQNKIWNLINKSTENTEDNIRRTQKQKN